MCRRCRRTHEKVVFWGPLGSPKTSKKRCKKERAKIEARSQKIRGLNLNPLAPAQSKRTFSFSGKIQKIIRNAAISAPFFASFLLLFRDFSGKAEKQVQGRSPGPQKHVKMDLKGAKTEPKKQQSTPQGPTKYKLPGRVLAEGDVDPAAGSPKEPFRL